ncbi:MAG: homoserine dehydrogenase [Actinobacteria bacterium]|uniref:Homoserine dehydrogenase n=1 Tax=freshwater metagenome TaxID=449393 RepID=A0A6J7DJL8_9ZZZZ|nr:homoserine dehydrogenase [Actinomycetota bacterium]MSX25028.1 homoserine dehydrogenase [Actinomycetota bacterium]MSY46518.1 homoserine dehydrogenase [Actinomycetota bacterium]MSY57212.1 homoserine dehydrogenase [Actinomycetota bacterium]
MNSSLATLKIGMLGCGNVGSQVARLLKDDQRELSTRSGAQLVLKKIAVRDTSAKRENVDASLLTTDAHSVVTDPEIDIVIEVMGGIEPARALILEAFANGKSVVTANKALLATHGADLYAAADKAGVDLYYEAAVAGAIPILRPLRESLVGDHVKRIMGIVNGTTNFILTKMDEEGRAFADVLAEAQSLGYAEADPTADLEGFDAAAKAAILAGLAFHTRVTAADVHREGISAITATDVAVAKSMNHVIKLLAIAELTADDKISVRVHPTLIPRTHPLAAVRDAFNAVFVEAESAGELMFYGRGAGGAPTASAILGDVVAVARHRTGGALGPRESDYADREIVPIGQTKTKYLIRLNVADKSGVLAAIAQGFATENVSIQTVRQTGRGADAELIVVTHNATEQALAATVKRLSVMDMVRSVESVIRVEGSSL